MTIRDIKINLTLERWEKKYAALFNEYSTGNHSEEVASVLRSRLVDINSFIEDLKVIHPEWSEHKSAFKNK